MHGIIAPPTRAAFPSTSPPQGMEVFFRIFFVKFGNKKETSVLLIRNSIC